MTVMTDESRAGQAADIMKRHGAVDIEERVATWRAGGWAGYNPDGTFTPEELEAERARYRKAA